MIIPCLNLVFTIIKAWLQLTIPTFARDMFESE